MELPASGSSGRCLLAVFFKVRSRRDIGGLVRALNGLY